MLPCTRTVQASMFMSELFALSYCNKPKPDIPYIHKSSKRKFSLNNTTSFEDPIINTSFLKNSSFNNDYYRENRWAFPGFTSTLINPVPPPFSEPVSEPIVEPFNENTNTIIEPFNENTNTIRDEFTENDELVLRFSPINTAPTPYPSKTEKLNRSKKQLPQQPTYDKIIALANIVFNQYGTGYTERVYQEGMYFSAYKNNIPCLMERHVYVTHDNTPLFIGKVDLEVAGRFVFELKIHAFNNQNLKKDRIQIEKYLRAYAINHHIIDRAALIYFTPKGVRVVEVEPFFQVEPLFIRKNAM
jgi:GxxExxY protein